MSDLGSRSVAITMLFALALSIPSVTEPAGAPQWSVFEVYSNVDGSAQFIELVSVSDGQNVITGFTLTATSDGNPVVFTIDSDPVGPTTNQFLLFATPGFASLPGSVTPDYTIPAGFFDPTASLISIDYAGLSVFNFNGSALPVDGMRSLLQDLSTPFNSPTNFAGESGQLNELPVYADGFEDVPCGAGAPGCFLMPFDAAPEPISEEAQGIARIDSMDVYVLLDRSGSMSVENNSVISNLASVANILTCPPSGAGDPDDCLDDLWWGSGSVGYVGAKGQPYTNHSDLNPSAANAASALVITEPGGCCDEAVSLATFSAVTGGSSADAGCVVAAPYAARSTCVGSPAGDAGFGYPCFRPEAFSVISIFTDEAPSATFNCPDLNTLGARALVDGVRLIGIVGNGATAAATTFDLQTLAIATDAVDEMGQPIVISGADSNAANALADAVLTLRSTRLDVSATLVDDPSDSVDVTTSFLDHIETRQLGTAECTDGVPDFDSNDDSFPDRYLSVPTGTPLCWLIILKDNTQVMATGSTQTFRATLEIRGDGMLLTETLLFVVPAQTP